MKDCEKLIFKMTEFDAGDPKRIQHFMKVYEYAHLIGESEGLSEEELHILEAAAVLHDIGIVPTERKLGYCNGKLQETEGPAYAKELLSDFPCYSSQEVDRIAYLIGHHHTYTNVEGKDYRILLEADFLVNALEDELPKHAVEEGLKNIFETETGKRLLRLTFGL